MLKYFISLGVISSIVIGALIYAVMKVGLPVDARALKFDETRSRNLQDIKYAVDNYVYDKKALPQKVSDLKLYDPKTKTDPETNTEYRFEVIDEMKYNLCATFNTDTKAQREKQQNRLYTEPVNGGTSYVDMTLHPKGEYCFENEFPKTAGVSYNTTLPGLNAKATPSGVPYQAETTTQSKQLTCRTNNTLMTVTGGKGTIGCDVIIEGSFNLASSYCEGQTTKIRNYLTKNYYGRKDYYYATLTGLDPTEEVIVYAASNSGETIKCAPTLNTSAK